MKDHVTKSFGFVKTTAIGGLIFLLPLGVIGWLLSYVFNIVMAIYKPLKEHLPFEGTLSLALLFLAAIGVLLGLCFICGLATRRAIARKFSQTIEKQLVTFFPKYAIYKDMVAGNIGGDAVTPSLKPVTVRFDDYLRIGFESGRTAQGLVIVYLPGSPDPWIGSVALVADDRVAALDVNFNETAGICERLGRDSAHMLGAVNRANIAPTPDL